ncbi:hypothetical protein ccbrp13_36910 [Ktedonobacteria bacterium brp13]|nr:hypothetical protein ccbrp13_36910 [Ktedonobacteria bacterium brp13]
MQKTFAASAIQQIIISNVNGELEIRGWDQGSIEVNTSEMVNVLNPEEGILTIQGCADKLTLHVPFECVVKARSINNNVLVEGIRSFQLQDARKKVTISDIQGEVNLTEISDDVALTNIRGEVTIGDLKNKLTILQAATVRILGHVHGNATFTSVGRLEARTLSDSANLSNIDYAEIALVGNTLEAQDIGTLNVKRVSNSCRLLGGRKSQFTLGKIGNKLSVYRVGSLVVNSVGDSCEIKESPQARIQLSRVGNNLLIEGAGQVTIGKVGNHCHVRSMQGNFELGATGNKLDLEDVAGNIQVGKIGGNANLRAIQGSTALGRVDGNLELQTIFPHNSNSHISVDGNANIELPADANLTIQATTGGIVQGQGIQRSALTGKRTILVYGEGAAHLEISAGGNLNLTGDTAPTSINKGQHWSDEPKHEYQGSEGGDWRDYKYNWKNYQGNWQGYSWDNFESEMSEFGREMAQLGQEIGQRIAHTVNEVVSSIDIDMNEDMEDMEDFDDDPDDDAAHDNGYQHAEKGRLKHLKEQLKANKSRLKDQQKHMEQQARQAGERANRLYVRLNDREWRMDPERVNRIVEQAQRAAAEGIQGAQEAVAQALLNLNVLSPVSPMPPMPPMPPVPPVPPFAPAMPPMPQPPMSGNGFHNAPDTAQPFDERNQPEIPVAADETGEQAQNEQPVPVRTAEDIEKERLAILRMIAEGRISPEEGDMLLEALS